MRYLTRCITLGGLLAATGAVTAQTYTSSAGFSPTSNPNGVWSFGHTPNLGGPFSYFTVNGSFAADGTGAPLAYWSAATPDAGPNVVHNATADPQILMGTAALDPGALVLGAGGDYVGLINGYAVARFSVPTTATYALDALFKGVQIAPACSEGTTTDVHILVNGSSVFSGVVNGWVGRSYVASPAVGPAPSQAYSNLLALAAGDTLDFTVGNGGNGKYCDGTQLSVQLVTHMPAAVPEPGSAALGAGLVCLGLLLLRRRTRPSPSCVR
jgi:hypothetical protein